MKCNSNKSNYFPWNFPSLIRRVFFLFIQMHKMQIKWNLNLTTITAKTDKFCQLFFSPLLNDVDQIFYYGNGILQRIIKIVNLQYWRSRYEENTPNLFSTFQTTSSFQLARNFRIFKFSHRRLLSEKVVEHKKGLWLSISSWIYGISKLLIFVWMFCDILYLLFDVRLINSAHLVISLIAQFVDGQMTQWEMTSNFLSSFRVPF